MTTAATLAMTAGLFACKPDATPEALQGKEWLTEFYKKNTMPGGWGFFGTTAKDQNVEVVINIPSLQSQQLLAKNPEDMIKFIANNSCPHSGETIWNILGTTGDIIIDSRSNGKMLIKISCKTKTGIEQ